MNLIIDKNKLRQDIQDFLETQNIKWNGLYINPNGEFTPYSNKVHKFKYGLLCTHMQEDSQMKTKFIKVSQHELSFYEYVEDSKGKGSFKLAKNYNRAWRTFLYSKYGNEYIDSLETEKTQKINHINYFYYNNFNPILADKNEYMEVQKYIDEIEQDLDYLYHKASYEEQYHEPYEESLENLLDPETLAELYKKDNEEDDEKDPFEDDYYFEESDTDDDEYEK